MAGNQSTTLSIKEIAFIESYLSGKSILQSMIDAGYSPKTASVQGTHLLKRVKVAKEIALRKEALAKKYSWTREEAIETLKGVIANPDKKSDIVNASKLLNSMMGLDSPQQINITGQITQITRKIIDTAK